MNYINLINRIYLFLFLSVVAQAASFSKTNLVQLELGLIKAAERGDKDTVNTIMENPRFDEISEYGQKEALWEAAKGGYEEIVSSFLNRSEKMRNGLDVAFGAAAGANKVDVVRTVLTADEKFRRIDGDSLGATITFAAKEGYNGVLTAILSSPRYKTMRNKVPYYSYLIGLERAMENGHKDTAFMLLGDPISPLSEGANRPFFEVIRERLSTGLKKAMENGHEGVVTVVLEKLKNSGRMGALTPEFQKECEDWIKKQKAARKEVLRKEAATKKAAEAATKEAATKTQTELREHAAQIKAERLKLASDSKAEPRDLKDLFNDAARDGDVNSTRAVLANPKYQGADADDLANPLSIAARAGHVGVVKTIMEHPKFDDVDAKILGHVLVNAAQAGHRKVMQVMKAHQRYQDIPDYAKEDAEEALLPRRLKEEVR